MTITSATARRPSPKYSTETAPGNRIASAIALAVARSGSMTKSIPSTSWANASSPPKNSASLTLAIVVRTPSCRAPRAAIRLTSSTSVTAASRSAEPAPTSRSSFGLAPLPSTTSASSSPRTLSQRVGQRVHRGDLVAFGAERPRHVDADVPDTDHDRLHRRLRRFSPTPPILNQCLDAPRGPQSASDRFVALSARAQGSSQAGSEISGRQDLNLRPLGPQPEDATAICVPTRPMRPSRPDLGRIGHIGRCVGYQSRYHGGALVANPGRDLNPPPSGCQLAGVAAHFARVNVALWGRP